MCDYIANHGKNAAKYCGKSLLDGDTKCRAHCAQEMEKHRQYTRAFYRVNPKRFDKFSYEKNNSTHIVERTRALQMKRQGYNIVLVEKYVP